MDYDSFITRKLSLVPPTGISGDLTLPADMKEHQVALTRWGLRRGRAAIFADTGLGKMRMELAWALTKAAWAMSGKPLPSYSRAEMPGRVIRRDER